MSSAELEDVIDAGRNLAAGKYYSIATTTIFFYDYFLTLADEVKYAWRRRKSWVFVLFIANRYLPIGYQLWFLYASFSPTFHQRLCDKTVLFEVLVTVETTLLAQVVLTLRIYAVTSKNRIITSCFCVITISQLILGLYIAISVGIQGAQPILPVPLPVYVMCIFVEPWFLDIAHPITSLVYDLLAFSVIVYLVVRSNVNKAPTPGLLRTIARDATYYFMVIFTSHLVLVMFLAFANRSIGLLPAPGNVVYLPVMITRLMLSLRKTNVSQERGWRLGEPTTYTTIRFADHRDDTSMGDEIVLDDLRARTGGLEIEPDGVNDITGDLSSSLHRERALDDLAP